MITNNLGLEPRTFRLLRRCQTDVGGGHSTIEPAILKGNHRTPLGDSAAPVVIIIDTFRAPNVDF